MAMWWCGDAVVMLVVVAEVDSWADRSRGRDGAIGLEPDVLFHR